MKRTRIILLAAFALILCLSVFLYRRSGSPSDPASTPGKDKSRQGDARDPQSANSQVAPGFGPQVASGGGKSSGASTGNSPKPASGAMVAQGKSSPSKAQPEGRPPVAKVRLGDKSEFLPLEPTGRFKQMVIPPNSTVAVEVRYPDGNPGDTVVIAPLDGGIMSRVHVHQKLDANRQVSFPFTVHLEGGTYRVAVRKGDSSQMLDFWVAGK